MSSELEVAVQPGRRAWTEEQRLAIERRAGDLLLDAAAGSGKTSVLVERFVESVLQDGFDVGAILTITFTEKAAAEMRERIRLRLRALGKVEAARATEGAYISTIHGFCARLLRAHALRAGVDPRFSVLEAWQAQRLADEVFEEVLAALGQEEAGVLELIAAYTPAGLRSSILATHAQLRSRGQLSPRLPPLAPPPDVEAARARLVEAAGAVAQELGSLEAPSARVLEALERLEHCSGLVGTPEPWPGAIAALALPGGNGAALTTAACQEYGTALEEFRAACEHRWAARAHRLLDRLLAAFARAYAQRKRLESAVDFEDLELMALELVRGDAELRERLRERFDRVMVDELQDTNPVQMELIELLSAENLFTVGDALQSIYGFRHADVELFAARGRALEAAGARLQLTTNFRSRPEILSAINRVFEQELGEAFRPLAPGREGDEGGQPRVEVLVADKGADWDYEALTSPWRVAEAQALAARLAELVEAGTAPGEVVLLLRAATDMRVYERALEDRGIPTYMIGGRGYWAHPQVLDMVCYLRALANPRDLEALYTVLVSPVVSVSLDTLVILAAAARAADRDPWWVISEPEGRLDELEAPELERLARFATWFAVERRAAARLRVDQLIDRALGHTAYDEAVLALPGGPRRLANLRKLMRLGQERLSASGDPLREFLELVRFRSAPWSAAERSESEAPVEGEGLDAVRLMTIHRAKGLEFPVVCVADLGRGPRGYGELMRIGADGRFGLRLAQPGTGRSEPALEYRALGEEQLRAEAREERRLFYVAMTRARERLILSGAAKLDGWPTGSGGGPISWLVPALVPELPVLAEQRRAGVVEGVALRFVDAEGEASSGHPAPPTPDASATAPSIPAVPPERPPTPPTPPPAGPMPAVTEISYSALEEYRRCGYRFYVERVLGLPPVEDGPAERGSGCSGPSGGAGASGGAGGSGGADGPARAGAFLSPRERGVLVHALLEKLDFRRPVLGDPASLAPGLPGEEAREILTLLEAFTASQIFQRLGRALTVRTEQQFSFLLGAAGQPEARHTQPVLLQGVFDVIAQEPGGGTVVVDYKTDRLEGLEPERVVQSSYGVQRLVYGLAALRAGAPRVEVLHTFLELPDRPAAAEFTRAELPRLEAELGRMTAGMAGGEFVVTPLPHRTICHGCPAEGGLCSWELAMTRRAAPDQLF